VTTYTAVARRVGAWWAISVPELKGVHTQAKRLDRVEATARDAIALMLDVPADSVKVMVCPEIPSEVNEALAARDAASRAEEYAAAMLRNAVRVLLDWGMTVRDTATLLMLSPARISQIHTSAHEQWPERQPGEIPKRRDEPQTTSVARTATASGLAQKQGKSGTRKARPTR